MDDVWGIDWFGSSKTLDVHVAGLRRRLGDEAQGSRYIHTVRGVGFRFSSRRGAARVTFRRRLVLAFAYLLVLIVVALAIPLGSASTAGPRTRSMPA